MLLKPLYQTEYAQSMHYYIVVLHKFAGVDRAY